jgi:cytochrome P450
VGPISDDIMGKFDHELADSFEYLKCCFSEALRIESPVPQSSPTTFSEDVVIDGVLINAHDQVIIAIDYM